MDAFSLAGNIQPTQRTLSVFHDTEVMPPCQSFLDPFSAFPNSGNREVKAVVPWQNTNAFQSVASRSPFGAVPRRRKRFPLSYVGVVATVILTSPHRQLTLSEIYQAIEARFPEFTASRVGWKNTVRHNLSLHDCFLKGELASHGRSSYWRVHPAYVGSFTRGDFRKLSRRAIDFYEKQSALHYEEINSHEASSGISPPFARRRAREGNNWGICLMSSRYSALDPASSLDNCLGSCDHLPRGVFIPYEEDM